MNNLETNALRIAGLMGWRYNPIFQQNTLDCNTYFADAVKISSNDELIELYSSYNGLMPIVFECNTGDNLFAIRFDEDKVDLLRNNKRIEFDPSDGGLYQVDYEEEPNENFFIEALQLAVIKYLELKNDNSRVQQAI